MIDGKTIYDWYEEGLPDWVPRWGWTNLAEKTQQRWNALAERINAEMGRPLVVESDAFTEGEVAEFFRPGAVIVVDPLLKAMESKEPYKPGDVVSLGYIPPGTLVQIGNDPNVVKMPVQRVPGALREKVYEASKEWWLTQLGFATPVDEVEAEKIKQLSEATYKKAIIHSAKFLGPMPMSGPMENPDHSTHHKSCALRHDGITCTCP